MESNVEDPQNTPAAENAEPAAPTRRRASRRVSAAAGAVAPAAEPAAPAAETAAAAAPAAEAAAVEAPAAPAADAPAAVVSAGAEAPAAAASASDDAPVEAAPKKRATRSRKKAEPAADAADAAPAPAAEESAEAAAAPAEAAAAPAETAAEAAPKKRATRSRKKAEPAADAASAAEAPAADAAADTATDAGAAAPAASEESAETAAPAKRGRGRRAQAAESAPETADAEAQTAAAEPAAGTAAPAAQSESGGDASERGAEGEKPARGRRNRRGQKNEAAENGESESSSETSGDEGKGRNKNAGNGGNGGGNTGPGTGGKNADDASARSSRTRQRDRKRRGQGDDLEPEITEDDVLLPIAGILDVLDNYAFVRTSGYLPGTSDVYVSLGQVKKYGLRRGDAVVGAIRQPREGEGNARQKYNAIVKIDTVNGRPVEENEKRADVAELTPVFPQERLRFETGADRLIGRTIDLVAPIGLGQRGILVLPKRVSGTEVVAELAAAVTAAKPDAHLMLVLADAQPEEATQLQRTVSGEVVAATFDRPAEDQATIAELAIDRAKRLVELGHDVVVLVDSLNRLGRAYTQAQHGQSRPAHDEIDEFALGHIKRLLAAARNVENGGSLTVLATVRSGTGLDADRALLREVREIANSEIRFAKTALGAAPAVRVSGSVTRGASAMLGEAESVALGGLRAALQGDDAEEKLVERLRATASNAALLAEFQRAGRLS
ncbi:hypothetical protein MUN77_10510 [Leucobacter allii]|uniref:hypothetical protein n=1 Tax=Leucobacter allii TaxID=2932247 RepID=UPI001FD09C57|nr:hypothetical protein [Leucobacter allii]UOR00601.1 hypothetical protein MUN77_10510 [Leucobacter allii]